MSALGKGSRVLHESYGAGVIDAKMVFDEWRVRFDREPTLPRTVRGRDLTPLNARAELLDGQESRAIAVGAGDTEQVIVAPTAEPDPPNRGTPAAVSRISTSRPRPVLLSSEPQQSTVVGCPRAWQTLEALRLGVVPAHGVEEYTVARAKELAKIRELLDAGWGCRVIWGEYGAGKTHLLDAAEHFALEQGWATARVTLDPSERALHHPLRLYQKITESVRTADLVSQGFAAIFDRLVDSPAHFEPNGDRASRFFSPYLHVLRHGRDEQVACLRDYVCGDKVPTEEVNRILFRLRWPGQKVLRMSDYRTFGRMYTHLVGTLATWCADAGARGLVLLFDEVERVETLESVNRDYAFEVLRHFAAVTIKTADLAFDPEQLYKGGHPVHRALPLRFRADQPLATIFALTPLEEIQDQFAGVTQSRSYELWLEGLDRRCVGDLVNRIARIYDRAYSAYAVTDAVVSHVRAQVATEVDDGHDSFRAVVRAVVFLLDADRCGGDRSAREESGTVG